MVRTSFLLFSLLFLGCEDRSFAPEQKRSEPKGEQKVIAQDDPVRVPVADVVTNEEVTVESDNGKERHWKERIRDGKRTEVTWDDLYEFDYKKGISTPFLKAIEGKPVRLPGFVIPLTDGSMEKLRKFLIVPEPMMCIHVPPPPPNLLLYGIASPPITINSLWEPVWLDGEIWVKKKESIYATAGFTMKVKAVEPYEELEYNPSQ